MSSSRPTKITDEGLRASDIINNHIAALGMSQVVNRWVAIRLSDGGSDGVLYDSRSDAIYHQLHENQCVYVCVPPGGTSPQDMTQYLDLVRGLYNKGLRLADPDNDSLAILSRRLHR